MWYKASVPEVSGYWCRFQADYIIEGTYGNLAKLKSGEIVAIIPPNMVIYKEDEMEE